jgi:hypothetical protein
MLREADWSVKFGACTNQAIFRKVLTYFAYEGVQIEFAHQKFRQLHRKNIRFRKQITAFAY